MMLADTVSAFVDRDFARETALLAFGLLAIVGR